MAPDSKSITTSDTCPGARLLITVELEPFFVVNTGLDSTSSGAKVSMILLACMLEDAFFMRTFKVNGWPA